jgi:ketosteroid isomerase-like protein
MSGADEPRRRRNLESARTFLRLLEEKDIDAWIGLWHQDAVQIYPFGTDMFPARVTGRAAVHAQWSRLPDLFASMRFPIRELWADGDTVLARFDGELVGSDGAPYQNTYLSVFHFTDSGELREYWEYFDPIRAGLAFGLAEVSYRSA